MDNSKLIRLLKALQPDEFRRLGKFLRSPYNNANPKVVALYDYLRRFYPVFGGVGMKKERAFSKLFPDQPFNNKSLGNLMSEFSLRVEDYFVALEIKEDQTVRQRMLIQAFGRRNLYQNFEKHTHALINKMGTLPYRDKQYFYELMELRANYYFHPSTHKYSNTTTKIATMMTNLDLFFALSKLDLSMEMMEWKRISGEHFEVQLLEEAKAIINNLPEEEHPALSIYRELIEFVETQTEENFFKLKAAFIADQEHFTETNQQSILQKLLNFTSRQIAKGKISYYKQYLDLIKRGLQSRILLESGQLNDTLYTNIAVVGSLLREFNWTRRFLNQYEEYIQSDCRKAAKTVGLAQIHFHQQDYHKSIELLLTIKTTKTDYLLRARSLSLRSYYELFVNDYSYYEMLEYETKSYERFIKRKALLTDQRLKAYQNLGSFARHMARIYINPNKRRQKIEKLRQEINKEHIVVAKRWLLQKLEALIDWHTKNKVG
ncbi:MAG: hypothetical protein AAGG75_03840 [Bacteroidota bacterium]